MMALIFVLDLLVNAISGDVSHTQLAKAIVAHYKLHLACYGYDLWKPKFHWVFNLIDQLEKWEYLLACFIHERKHKVIKRWARDFTSKVSWERCVLEEITLQSLTALLKPLWRPFLVDPGPAPEHMSAALTEYGIFMHQREVLSAKVAYIKSRAVEHGDVVLFNGSGALCVGQIYFFCSVGNSILCCLSPWHVTERSTHSLKAVVTDSPCVVTADLIYASAIYTPVNVGQVATILLQCSFKQK